MQDNDDDLRPKVGVGVMVLKNGKVLIGKRKGAHGAGEWAWPGGHLEYMESFEDCARREVMEETGIEIHNIRFLRLMNLKEYAPKHYVDIGLVAEWLSGEPKVTRTAFRSAVAENAEPENLLLSSRPGDRHVDGFKPHSTANVCRQSTSPARSTKVARSKSDEGPVKPEPGPPMTLGGVC